MFLVRHFKLKEIDMRRNISVMIVVLFFMSITALAHAEADSLLEGMGGKLWRGAVNTLTGWVELPAQLVKGWNNGCLDNVLLKPVGLVAGLFDGVTHTVGRTVSGAVDIATFWTADIADLDHEGVGLALDDEYAWQEGDAKDITDPNFIDGAVMPVGRKFMRGVGNTLFGTVELPGQFVKGMSESALDLGIVKGIWYTLSREVDGVTDIATCLFPSPEDSKGLTYDEVWPWEALGEGLKDIY